MSQRSRTSCNGPRRDGRPAFLCIALACAALAACGGGSQAIPRALLREARPVGAGPRFQPGVSGAVVGDCRPALGRRYAVHVEVFAQNEVVIVPAGIGTRAPRTLQDGQVVQARCFGALVTLAPTGVVLVRKGVRLTLGELFRAWGEPLSRERVASFRGNQLRVFVDGRSRRGLPSAVPLRRHAEIVLELGPYVPPHRGFAFPPGE